MTIDLVADMLSVSNAFFRFEGDNHKAACKDAFRPAGIQVHAKDGLQRDAKQALRKRGQQKASKRSLQACFAHL